MGRVFFARHGQCEANIRQTAAGSLDDCDLTAQGELEARELAKKVKQMIDDGVKIDRIVSSPLVRTVRTAQIVSEATDVDVEIEDDLKERSLGKATGSKYGVWHDREFDPEMSIETREDFAKRVVAAYEKIAAMQGNSLIVSHGGVARVLQAYLAGDDLFNFVEQRLLDNCEIMEISKGGNDD